MREKLKIIVEDNTTKGGRLFDYIIQFLIFLSLVAVSIETLPGINLEVKELLHAFEIFCIGIFTIEYLLRIYVSSHPFKYIFSFYGIVDVLAILPFYLHWAIDLRPLRTFRIFRIFRALKLIRYHRALRRFHIAARIVKEEMVLFLIVTCILMYLAGSGIYFFEHEAQPESYSSIFHSLWWAVVTLTAVGYGDMYPITLGGRIFTFFVLIIGIGVISVPAGLVATALAKARTLEEEEQSQSKEEEAASE
jgi:voltage-gated potassium channel